MRLIDADALMHHLADYQLQESPQWGANGYGNADKHEAITECIEAITDAPTIDAVEVVRCSQCKWSDWYKAVDGEQYCHCMETGCGGRTADDFCSFGEREGE